MEGDNNNGNGNNRDDDYMNNNTGKGTLPKEPMNNKGKKRRNEEDGASPNKRIRIEPPSAKEPIHSTSSPQEVIAIASSKSSLQEASTKDLHQMVQKLQMRSAP